MSSWLYYSIFLIVLGLEPFKFGKWIQQATDERPSAKKLTRKGPLYISILVRKDEELGNLSC